MVSSFLPDVKRFSPESPVVGQNAVISAHTNTKYCYPEHQTPYLFITNAINKGQYFICGNRLTVSDRQFLFLNANEHLAIEFTENAPLHTLFIMFDEAFLLESFDYYFTSEEKLLDNPDFQNKKELWLPQVPYQLHGQLRSKTTQLQYKRPLKQQDIDGILFELIGCFLQENAATKMQLQKIKAIKRATKEELYRRMALVVDWMQDKVDENLTLDEMAKMACLNKFHFLDGFKSLHATTPMQYFRALKLQKAYKLLQQKYSVTEVCFSLGFESLGSFSNLFKKHFGITPSSLYA